MKIIPREIPEQWPGQPAPSLASLSEALSALTGLPPDDTDVQALAANCHATYKQTPDLRERRFLPVMADVLRSGWGEVTGIVAEHRVHRVRLERVVKCD